MKVRNKGCRRSGPRSISCAGEGKQKRLGGVGCDRGHGVVVWVGLLGASGDADGRKGQGGVDECRGLGEAKVKLGIRFDGGKRRRQGAGHRL